MAKSKSAGDNGATGNRAEPEATAKHGATNADQRASNADHGISNTDHGTSNNLVVQCPTCKKPVPWRAEFPHRPFCSARCKDIDFGDWILENHAIPGGSLEGVENPDDEPGEDD